MTRPEPLRLSVVASRQGTALAAFTRHQDLDRITYLEGDPIMGTIMHETTVQHPGWCNASECVEYEGFSDVDHRTIPRPIAMDYVTGTMYLSGWAESKDTEVTPDLLMVHAQLKSVELVEELLLMLSPAEARTLAAELLVLAETAEGGA